MELKSLIIELSDRILFGPSQVRFDYQRKGSNEGVQEQTGSKPGHRYLQRHYHVSFWAESSPLSEPSCSARPRPHLPAAGLAPMGDPPPCALHQPPASNARRI